MTSIQSSPLGSSLEHPDAAPAIVGGNAQAVHGRLQGLLCKTKGYVGALRLHYFGLLLIFMGIQISMTCYEVLTGCPLVEANAELVLFTVTLTMITPGMIGTNHVAANQLLILLASMIDGGHAEIQTNYIQSKQLQESRVWDISDYAKAVAATLLVGLITIGAWVAWILMVNRVPNDPILEDLKASPVPRKSNPVFEILPEILPELEEVEEDE